MKRLFTFILAVIMVAGMIPATQTQAFALELEEIIPEETIGDEIIPAETTAEENSDDAVTEEIPVQDFPKKDVVQASTSISGTCGENLSWNLDDAGTLTISGTGPMRKYTFLDPAPWHSNRASIQSVMIETGVTTISGFAFYDCAGLTSATISDSVTSIGDSAFEDCIGLTSITIGEGVTSIGFQAFDGCTKLPSITIPDSVTSIGHKAFQYCTDLTSITIGDGLTKIDSYAFFNCTGLESITIPNNVTSIGSNAFACCYTLKSITLSDSLTRIGSDAFNACTSLENIRIPDNVKTIELRTFYECTGLVSVTLPAKLTSIDDKAFYLCESIKSLVIPEGVTEIGDNAFNSCRSLESIWIPLTLTDVDMYAFTGCPIKDVYYPGSSKQFRSIHFGPVSNDDFRKTATFHFGIPDLVTPTVCLVNNAQTGLQELTWEPIEDAVRYETYRATNTNGPFTLVSDSAETVWRDPAAVIGKTYYYQVKAIHEDPDRSSALSQPVAVTYVCAKPVVSIANDSKGKPKLSWAKISGAKKYTVYRATSETGKYSSLGTTTKLYYTDSKAKSGTTYFYKVIANASKSTYNSPYSNIVSCNVICGTPSVTVKIDSNTGKPSLSWKKIDGAAKYRILRQLPGEETFTVLAEQTGVTFADKTAPIDTLCVYMVQALGKTEELNGQLSKEISATSGIAKPVVKGKVDAITGKPTLTWEAVEGAVKYEIYRSTKSNKSYTLIDTVEDGNAFTDDTAAKGKTYYYKVKAIGEVSKSADSSYVKLASKCATPVIAVKNADSGKPYLSWEKISGAKKYTVYRATSETGKYSKLGTTTKLTYTDSSAKAGTTYFYKVIANASSSTYNSGYSNIVSCPVICGTPSVTVKIDANTGKPSLSWKKVDGAAQYIVARRLPGEEVFTIQSTQTGLTFADKTAPIDTKCEYVVQALGKTEELNGNPSGVVAATSGIAKPVVKGSVDAITGKPVLTWEAVEGAVKYEIYRSTSSSKSYKLVETVEGLSFTDAALSAGKTYYYKVKAIGEVSKSADSSYAKVASKCATPVIAVKNADSGKPYLSWEKISGAKKYTVYRATSETGKYSSLGTTTKTYYTDSKAKSGTTYFYKIVANGSSSTYNSGYSNIVSCNVICGTPSVTVKIDANTGKPSLSWKKIDGAAKYRILRQLPGEETFTVLAEQTGVTFADTTAPIDTKCVYIVQALGKTEELNGQLSKEISATSGIAKPVVKGSVDAITGKPTLTWEAVEGAVSYNIYRSTKSGSGYKLVETVEGLSFTDAALSAGKTYYYKVEAVGEVSKSAQSSYVKLASKCATPEISVSVNEKSGKPVLTWEKITSAKKYTVYRATSETGKYSKLGTTTKLTYTDSKAKAGTTYFYKIVANASSSTYNSAYSNIVSCPVICGTPSVTVKTDAATGKPVVSWKKIDGAVSYDIYRDGQLLTSITGVSYTDKTAETGKQYTYTVHAIGKQSVYDSALSGEKQVTATCAQPKISGKVGTNKKPVISWDDVEGATKYIVYRSTSKSKGYKAISEATELPTYEDLTAKKGKTYYYKVVAIGDGCQSAQSGYVKVKSK